MNEKPFPFPGLEPPEPDPRLRARVLRSARQAAAKARTSPFGRFVDRLWSNRPLRLVWLAATLALLAMNASVGNGVSSTTTPPDPGVVRVSTVGELVGTAGGERHAAVRLAVAREAL